MYGYYDIEEQKRKDEIHKYQLVDHAALDQVSKVVSGEHFTQIHKLNYLIIIIIIIIILLTIIYIWKKNIY